MLLVLGSVLAYFARPWYRAALSRLRRWRLARQQARLDSAEHAWALARQQLAARPAQLGGLYLWVRRSTGDRTLSEFSRPLPDLIENRLLAFFKSRFGAEQPDNQALADLTQALPDVRRAVAAKKQAAPTRHGLKSLNP
ncbi:hypothetical protein D9M70_617650 [compost metagenome]